MATATAARTVKTPKRAHHAVPAPDLTRLRPLGDRIVVRPSPRDEMTKSGIVIPDTVKERPQEGEILAVGPGRILDDGTREKIDLRTGEQILYAKYAGTEFKLDGEDLLIVAAKDILAVLEPGRSGATGPMLPSACGEPAANPERNAHEMAKQLLFDETACRSRRASTTWPGPSR